MRRKMPVILTAVVMVLFLFSAAVSAATSGGTSIDTAPTVSMGATSINYVGSITYFKFVAPQNYSYEIYSSSISADSYGFLYDSTGAQLAYNDDAGGNLNFKIVYNLSGGSTYYIGVRTYNQTGSGTCNLNIDYGNAPPVVTDGNISISGATGTGGTYKIGDTVTALWNNTSGGDNNMDISSVYVNFSQFGGGSSVTATNSSGTWTAQYTITSGTIDTTNRNISVTATDTGGLSTTASDTTNASVDNIAPIVTDSSINVGPGVVFTGGETISVDWTNTSTDDIVSVAVDFTELGGSTTNSVKLSSVTWLAGFQTVSLTDVSNVNVTLTAIDNAGNSATASDTSNVTIDTIVPVVYDGTMSVSGASGTGGTFKTGDTISVSWDNTSPGLYNTDIVSVEVDLSEFGGNSATSSSNNSEIWTAIYTITEGSIDNDDLDISVYITDDIGHKITYPGLIYPSFTASLDNESPSVSAGNISISGATGTSGTFIAGDTITTTWDNTSSGDDNDDIDEVTVDFSNFGGGASVAASNSSGTWTAQYTITSGSIDSADLNVSVTATDDAGNNNTVADTSDASMDNQAPAVSDSNISISGATGNGGVFIIGDTVTAQWDNTSTGDNNSDIVDVTVDFSDFGGGAVVVASNNSGTWTAIYTIIEDSIEASDLNISVMVTDDAGQQNTMADSTDAAVDSIFPTVSLTCSNLDNLVKGSDTVIITAAFSESMSVSPLLTIDGDDVTSEGMTDSGDGTTWTYEWVVPFYDKNVVVSLEGSDSSGNPYVYNDFITIEIDSTKPVVTGVSDGDVYVTIQTIFFNGGSADLNSSSISNGKLVKNIGDYLLVVTDRAGNVTTVEFSIALEKTISSVGNYYYRLIDIEREVKGKETKVMLNINSEVLAMVLDTEQENKDIKVTVLENKADKSIRKFSLGMTLADLQLIKSKDALVSLETEIGSFELDPKLINIDRLLESFMGVAAKDIWVELKISPAHYFRKYVINRASEMDGNTVVSKAVAYDLYCSYGNKTVTTVSLHGEMDIFIPVSKEYSAVGLQAVRLLDDMSLETIETEIVFKNGMYYAKFRSSMNGTFALVTEK